MSFIPGMDDRLPMKLWSWLGAFHQELLHQDPISIASSLSPEMFNRVIILAPRIAQWLLALAEAAEAIKRTAPPTNKQKSSAVVRRAAED
jgi:hypothetical protein